MLNNIKEIKKTGPGWHILFVFLLVFLNIFSCSYDYLDGKSGSENTNISNLLIQQSQAINIWPDGIMNFRYAGDIPDFMKKKMDLAMGFWEETGVEFREIQPEEIHTVKHCTISIVKDRSYSSVGYNIFNSYLNIEMYASLRIIVHELGHSLGLYHEHQRPDRDNYVTILWENIEFESRKNFEIMDNPLFTEDDYPYDFESVMHYGRSACSIDNSSITIEAHENEIYSSVLPSEFDIQKVKDIYGLE